MSKKLLTKLVKRSWFKIFGIMKERVYERLKLALRDGNSKKEFAHLTSSERQSIRAILKGTLRDLPAGW